MSLLLGIIASSRGNIVPPLDTFGGAAAAYSTRLLSSAYGGSAVRVRRSFDNTEQDIGFSGGAIDETALMNFVGYQNLYIQSQTFTDASWVKTQSTVTANAGTDPFGGNNATRWLSNVGATNQYLAQSVSLINGQSYTVSFYAKSNTGSTQLFRFLACDNMVSSDFTATTDWQRFQFTFVANTSLLHGIIRPTTNTASDLLIYGAQINVSTTAQTYQVTTSAARSGDGFVTKWYTQDSNGENLFQQSQTFENVYWQKSQTSVSVNATTAPDGTLTADKLTELAANDVHYIASAAGGMTTTQFYTISVYAKAAERSWFAVYLYDGVNSRSTYFNLSTGVTGTVPVGYNASIQSVGNGWYRCSVSAIVVGSATTNGGFITATGDNQQSYLGVVGSGVFLWGAQLSQSSWLQGYQATTTSQVFRRDASQSTAANQPRIVGGGVIERENGKATMFFDGVDDVLAMDTVAPLFAGEDIPLSVFSLVNVMTAGSLFSIAKSNNNNPLHIPRPAGTSVVPNQRRDESGTIVSVIDPFSKKGAFTYAHMFSGTVLSVSNNDTDTVTASPMNVGVLTGLDRASIGGLRYNASPNGSSFIASDISELILYPTYRYTDRNPIQRNIGAYYQTQWTGASSGLLDQFGGAAAAYSLRNLSSSYRGSLIRVRRSSDNAETDIGGTYNGDLDVASLVSFTGGQNLLTNSENFSDSYWTKSNASVSSNSTISPDNTLTADSLIENTSNTAHYTATPSIAPVANTAYTFSVYAKTAGRSIAIQINLNAGGVTFPSVTSFDIINGIVIGDSAISGAGLSPLFLIGKQIQNIGNGWYRCSVSFISPTGSTALIPHIILSNSLTTVYQNTPSYLGNGSSGAYLWGAQLNTGILQPYIPTTTAAVSGSNAFVTKWYTQDANYQNLLLYSEQFENVYWNKNLITVSTNSIIAPDGNLTAETMSETAASGDHYLGLATGLTLSTTPYTLSCYYKANQRTWATMSMYNGTNSLFAYFDIQNGVLGNVDAGATASIQSVGNGWYRCSMTRTMGVSSNFVGIGVAPSNGVNIYLGVAGSGVYVWGAQLNEGTLVPYTATTTTISQRRDAIQATAASQPRIVNAGGVESEGNKPAVFWTDGSGMRLTASFPAIPSPQSFFVVNRIGATSGIAAAVLFDSFESVQNVYAFSGTSETPSNTFLYGSGSIISGPANSIPVQNITNVVHDTTSNIYDNNLLTFTGNAGTNSLSGLSIGNSRGNPVPSPAPALTYDWFGDIQEFIVYPSNLATRLTINSNINSYYQIYWQGNGTALLDNFSGASAAYSLRNLSSAYTGPLIRVRRSGDNVERDVYGTFAGDLDIASLVAFVGANSGFVTTWYDQSGNARHATQGTAANQPRIVNAGVVDTENGKPAVFINGAKSLYSTITFSTAQMYSHVSVHRVNAVVSFIELIQWSVGVYMYYLDSRIYSPSSGNDMSNHGLGTSRMLEFMNWTFGGFNDDGIQQLMIYATNGVSRAIIVNKDQLTTNTITAPFLTSSSNASMYVQERVFYNQNQSSNQAGLQTNINNYYKIY